LVSTTTQAGLAAEVTGDQLVAGVWLALAAVAGTATAATAAAAADLGAHRQAPSSGRLLVRSRTVM